MAERTWVSSFLEHLAANGNTSRSARLAGVTSTVVYAKRKTDADFDAACASALEDATDCLDYEVRRRGLEGVEEPVVYQGQLTPLFKYNEDGEVEFDEFTGKPVRLKDEAGQPKWLTIRKYSDTCLLFQLKGLRRRVYGDKTEISGVDGGPIQMDEPKRISRLAALLGMAKDRKDIV